MKRGEPRALLGGENSMRSGGVMDPVLFEIL